MNDQKDDLNQGAVHQEHKPEEAREKIKELEDKCEEYLKGWQRARADYENLRKETDKNIAELRSYIKAEMVLDLLPVYDHYKLALCHIPQDQQETDWIQGIAHIHRELTEFLKQQGIEEINTKGQKFDPELHEAVATEASTEAEGQIVKEIKSGFRMNDVVLRPAQVIVSKLSTISDVNNVNISKEGQSSGNVNAAETGASKKEN